jgi:hypothetical protein
MTYLLCIVALKLSSSMATLCWSGSVTVDFNNETIFLSDYIGIVTVYCNSEAIFLSDYKLVLEW